MALATTDADGRPSARVVLCKEIVIDPGYLVFYTNYESRKGHELAAQPWAAVVFHWDAAAAGSCVSKARLSLRPPRESDDYFASRPWQSRLAALTSQQSAPIASRQDLLEQLRATAARFGTPDPVDGRRRCQAAACACRDRPAGAAITCGRQPSNSGSRVNTGCTTVSAGHAN